MDHRTPSHQVFTHAIVALPDGKGGWQFCDPTIAHARPGLLSPHDTDREVLVVTVNGAEWVRTPAQPAGGLDHRFDLKLSPTGELSGWFTLTADGYFSASQRERFEKLNPDETRDSLTRLLRGFYAGAEVVDVVKPPADAPASDASYVIKAYFLVPQSGSNSGAATALTFPQSAALFYDVGHTSERRSGFFVWREHLAIRATIALPAGLAPTRLPDAYRLASPVGAMNAQWRFADGVCQMELQLDHPQALIAPSDFPLYYNALQSLRTWLEQPVVLAAGGPAPTAPATAAADLDLPLMPTGEGQINLVDVRYPESGNRALRRAALDKTLQFFPKDKGTVFRANVRLASLDWNEDKNQAVVDRLRPLLAGYQADVSPEIYSWGESMLGLALSELGQKDEATRIFVRLARTPALSEFRRSLEALHAANLLQTAAPDEAIALLAEATKLDSEYRGNLYALLARLLLRQGKAAELRTRLAELRQSHPQETEAVLIELVRASARWDEPDEDARRQTLLALVTENALAPSAGLTAALAEAGGRQLLAQAVGDIQARLKSLAAATPPPAWLAPVADDTLKTFADYDRAVTEAEKKNDAARCVQLAAQALATLPPGADFSRRLWLAAANADWQERLATPPGPVESLTALLDLCERLPAGDTYRFEGRMLRATRLARDRDFRAEQEIYQGLLAPAAALPDTFLAAVHSRLALCLESQGDYAAALASFHDLEPHLADSAKAADRFLHAIFINLHEDRPAEALREITLLEKIPATIREQAVGKDIIAELVELGHSGHAEEFWAAEKTWWPAWEALARDLGLPAAGPETVAPVIPDLPALGATLGRAQRANDRVAYFQSLRPLLSAARWLPSSTFQLVSLQTGPLLMLDAAHRPAWRLALIGLFAAKAPELPDNGRRRQLMLAAYQLDAGQPVPALRTIAAYHAARPPTDLITYAMNRIWGFAALARAASPSPGLLATALNGLLGGSAAVVKTELAGAAQAIEHDLENPDYTDQRASAVTVLADLFHSLDRTDDEAKLLQRELTGKVLAADKDALDKISARLGALTGPAHLAKAVRLWVAGHQPAWYAFAEPARLADPRLRNLETVLKNAEAQLGPVEAVKLRLLVAQDPSQSPQLLGSAWGDALRGLLKLTSTHAEARQLLDSLLDDQDFDLPMRLGALSIALFDAYAQEQPEDYARWRKHPLNASFSAQQQDTLVVLDEFMAADHSSKDALLALAKKLTAGLLSQPAVGALKDIVGVLLRLGETAAARQLVDGLPAWQFAPDVSTPRPTLQIEFARQLRAAEALAPLHAALVRRVVQEFPALPTAPPLPYAALRRQNYVPGLPPDVTEQACLWLIQTHRFDPSNLSFWGVFLQALQREPKNEPLVLDLARLLIEQPGDDSQRAGSIVLLLSALDLDNAGLRQKLEPLFAKYRQPLAAPQTYAIIRDYEIRVALRTGQPVDLATAYDGQRGSAPAAHRDHLQIVQALQARDLPALKRLVDAIPPEQLLDPARLPVMLPALDLLGLKDEAKLAREAARRQLRQMILFTWAVPEDNVLREIFPLAHALNEPDLLPPLWVQFIRTNARSPFGQLHILWLDAMQHRDWAAAVAHTDELLKAYPTSYGIYWLKAQALWGAGRKAEAAEPLATYARFSKDEVDYPEAVTGLRELGLPVP